MFFIISYLCFWFFLSKANFCIYSILKSTFNNNKQTTKTIVEFYTKTSFKQQGPLIFIRLLEKHDVDVALGMGIPDAKKDWTWTFFKTFYLYIPIQGFVYIHFVISRACQLVQLVQLDVEQRATCSSQLNKMIQLGIFKSIW